MYPFGRVDKKRWPFPLFKLPIPDLCNIKLNSIIQQNNELIIIIIRTCSVDKASHPHLFCLNIQHQYISFVLLHPHLFSIFIFQHLLRLLSFCVCACTCLCYLVGIIFDHFSGTYSLVRTICSISGPGSHEFKCCFLFGI